VLPRNLFYIPLVDRKSQLIKQAINHPSAWANASMAVLHIYEQEGKKREHMCMHLFQ